MTDRTEETLARHDTRTKQHRVYDGTSKWHEVCPACHPDVYAQQYAKHKKKIYS